jgi:hypothetical protein
MTRTKKKEGEKRSAGQSSLRFRFQSYQRDKKPRPGEKAKEDRREERGVA